MSNKRKIFHLAWRWGSQIIDPLKVFRGGKEYLKFFSDWYTYIRMPGAEQVHFIDTYPQLHDRTTTTYFDPHYFYLNNWAVRRIVSISPRLHVDIGSQTIFASMLASFIPVIFVDFRPLLVSLPSLFSVGGNILQLPFADSSINSVSCLHVVEHIGLGRYGDPLNPEGTKKALQEIARVLTPEGNLFLGTPVGKPKVCFNSHRIHTAEAICKMVPHLELIEFSGVNDAGGYVEDIPLPTFSNEDYACGFFWLRRK